MTEIAGALGLSVYAADAACAQLVADHALIVVENTYPDPHLAGVNLSIAAPVVLSGNGAQSRAAALEDARAYWGSWLGEFLGEHRCQ